MLFYAQRMVHPKNGKDRFNVEHTKAAFTHPQARLASVEDAVDWLETTVASQAEGLSPKQLTRSGYGDPERLERMSDGWRTALAAGRSTGTIMPAGEGYVVHIHVFPEQNRRSDRR